MKKKLYEKPSWGVIEMRQKLQLLVGSFTGSRGTGDGIPYGLPEDY